MKASLLKSPSIHLHPPFSKGDFAQGVNLPLFEKEGLGEILDRAQNSMTASS
jgi:hypothetical protein